MNDLDHLLRGGQALHHLGAHGPLADARDERLDHLEVDVGFQQGHAHFAQRLVYVRFGQATLAR